MVTNSKIIEAQEPRLLTHLANEGKLRDIFEHGLDPYASISSLVFKKDYWECMEHHQDGTPNPDGKALRKKAKTILLGKQNVMPLYTVMYIE